MCEGEGEDENKRAKNVSRRTRADRKEKEEERARKREGGGRWRREARRSSPAKKPAGSGDDHLPTEAVDGVYTTPIPSISVAHQS
jgi:hypothetical protein